MAPTNKRESIDAPRATTAEKDTLKTSIDADGGQEKDPHAAGTVLGSYVFGRNLGKGTFGKVKLATH